MLGIMVVMAGLDCVPAYQMLPVPIFGLSERWPHRFMRLVEARAIQTRLPEVCLYECRRLI